MLFSVIVPTYNARATLPELLESLQSQTFRDFETILVDDCSTDSTAQLAKSYPCKFFRMARNSGPAACRNRGAKAAGGEILVFTDSDCRVEPHWLERIRKRFREGSCDAVMGRLVLAPSTFLGDAVSALGFPAGGSVGFDRIWRVDERGYTDSLSSCNCALRKDAFLLLGGFDESFPFPGGEDSLLAYALRTRGYRIRYCPEVVAHHAARDSLGGFIRWQLRRGMSSYLFSRRVSNKGNFLKLRLWSTGNILRHSAGDAAFPLVVFLLVLGYSAQLLGFALARKSRSFHEGTDHQSSVAR